MLSHMVLDKHMPLSNCQNLHKVINDPNLFFLGSENMHGALENII